MDPKPFLINGIVGNSRMLVTLTGDGEIQRVFWPHIDRAQHVHRLLGGVAVGDGAVEWQNSPAWHHSQSYEPDQNILVTTAVWNDLEMESTDGVAPGRDLLVRRLRFTNRSRQARPLRYVLYQWMRIDESPLYNATRYDEQSDSLIHYRRDIYLAAGSDRAISAFGIGNPEAIRADATHLHFGGRTILNGDMAAAAVWDLGSLAPGSTATLTLFWACGRNNAQVRALLAAARQSGGEAILAEIRADGAAWLARARGLSGLARPESQLRQAGIPLLAGLSEQPADPDQVQELYRRSLLVFRLMCDEQTGAVIAAPEFDPGITSCGGYAYCWGRDGAYITVAMDLAGYHDLAAGFYRWAVESQEPEGWWAQRHSTAGDWGPSWGLIQVDETGSILYGMARHADLHGGPAFARSVWPTVARAADWLIRNIDPQTGLPISSVDLWEERTAQLTYSSAAVSAGLAAAARLGCMVGETEAAVRYQEAAEALQQAIRRECIRDGRFLRSRYLQVDEWVYHEAVSAGLATRQTQGARGFPVYEVVEDAAADISLLGLAVPFATVEPADPAMAETARHLTESLWVGPSGGMRRYVGDQYRGGNPWVLCTLWLGLYEAKAGRRESARRILDWALARRSETGLLPEQSDAQTGRPVWVLPLTWSHAMFVLLALALYGEGGE